MIIFAKRINIKGVIYNLMNYNEYNKRKYSSFYRSKRVKLILFLEL